MKKLTEISPAERACGVIDSAMRELALIRHELAAQVPRRKPRPPATHLVDVRTGRAERIRPKKVGA